MLRYCASACSYAARAYRSRCSSVPPSNSGCVTLAARVQKPLPGVNSSLNLTAWLPPNALRLSSGRRLATATPIRALADCRLRSACLMSGRCSTSLEGRLTGRSSGRRNVIQREHLRDRAARQVAGQGGDQVALLRQLLLQRRQRRLRLGQQRSPAPARPPRRSAPAASCLRKITSEACSSWMMSSVALICAAQRRLVDGGDHQVGRERQICRLELVALLVRQRHQRLDLPPVQPQDVRRVGLTCKLGGDQRVVRVARRRRGGQRAAWRSCCGSARRWRSRWGRSCLPAHRGSRAPAAAPPAPPAGRVVAQCAREQRVQLRGVEQRPPVAGNVEASARRSGAPCGRRPLHGAAPA